MAKVGLGCLGLVSKLTSNVFRSSSSSSRRLRAPWTTGEGGEGMSLSTILPAYVAAATVSASALREHATSPSHRLVELWMSVQSNRRRRSEAVPVFVTGGEGEGSEDGFCGTPFRLIPGIRACVGEHDSE